MTLNELLKKYDVPTPRYTSYPTVPCWDQVSFNEEKWKDALRKVFKETNAENGISLYLHLPFCESLCTYCACTTRITKNHNIEIPYIETILREWEIYKNILGRTPVIRELHLGGGTPTFFKPENLSKLISGLLSNVIIHDEFEFSFEGHPNNTTEDHLRTLYAQGFRRVSFGVQDLDEKVQRTINRIQPFENLERVIRQARNIGYKSVSIDLVYGLPFQNSSTISNTIDKVLLLKPDRVSFYSYAHVPWLKPGQRGYEDADLPSDRLKRNLYETGRNKFREAGYVDIGMDHFALPHDDLNIAHESGTLHRNFMGYTTTHTKLLVGLGASAISDAGYAYAQNLKKVEEYRDAINENKLAVFKGHVLSTEDILIRKCILQISCQGRLSKELLRKITNSTIDEKLLEMESEGIVELREKGLTVTAAGEPFIRNICRVFDKRMNATDAESLNFSKAI